MAIQPLATQIQAPQIQTPNPINQMGQLMALRDSQQQNQMRTMQMQDLQQKQAREEQVRNVFASGGEPDRNALYAADPITGMAYDKFKQEQQKTSLEMSDAERKAAHEITADYHDQISRLNTTDPNVFMRDFGLATGMIHGNEVMSKVFANTRASTEGSMKEAYAAAQAGPEAMEALKARITTDAKTFQSNLEKPHERAARLETERHNRAIEAAAMLRANKTGEQAQKPLTANQEVTLRKDMGKSRASVNQTVSLMEEVKKAVQDVRGAPGKEGATGLSGYVPSFPGSAASKADLAITNLKGKLTALGRSAAALSGAIGPMAVQEWKIVADQIAAFDQKKMTPDTLENQLGIIEAAANTAATNIQEAYETTFGEYFEARPEFALKEQVKPGKGASGGGVDTNNPLLK